MNNEENQAIDECFEDIVILNKFFDKDYITLEEFYNIKKKIVDRIIDVRIYYRDNG